MNQNTWEDNRLKLAFNLLRICEFGQNSVFLTLEQIFKEYFSLYFLMKNILKLLNVIIYSYLH